MRQALRKLSAVVGASCVRALAHALRSQVARPCGEPAVAAKRSAACRGLQSSGVITAGPLAIAARTLWASAMGPAVTLHGALGAAAAAAGGAGDDSAELDEELSSLEELDTERPSRGRF